MSLEAILKERFGLLLSYIGGLALYFSTDFTTAESVIYYPTGQMVHPVVVIHEWLLIFGVFLVAVGFLIDFTKQMAPADKILIATFALFPLWKLLPLLFTK